MLMLIVLLAPVLMLAAGIFVGQRNAGDDTGNANPEARKTAHSAESFAIRGDASDC